MSEQGFAVGVQGLYLNPGESGYIRDIGGNLSYSTDQENWYNFDRTLLIYLYNNNPADGFIYILFTTDITIDNNNCYFICGSDKIQIGSSSLNNDGSRPIITIDVDNYDGLIENSSGSEVTGYNNIYVYNLIVDGTGYSTQVGAGWIGKKYFGNNANNNYFINCSSLGNLPGGQQVQVVLLVHLQV